MTTVIAVHDVDDVAHWLKSPKRAEFFGAHGMTVTTFVSPGGKKRVGLVIENARSLEACSDTNPIMNTITAEVNNTALILVKRPAEKNV